MTDAYRNEMKHIQKAVKMAQNIYVLKTNDKAAFNDSGGSAQMTPAEKKQAEAHLTSEPGSAQSARETYIKKLKIQANVMKANGHDHTNVLKEINRVLRTTKP